jgi:hypothetical protein
MDKFPPGKHRAALLELIDALGVRRAALDRDDGGWKLQGKFGCIYAHDGWWLINLGGRATLGWNRAKEALGSSVTVIDDQMHVLGLAALPDASTAEIIRHYVGLPKRAVYSEAQLEAKRAAFAKVRARKPASEDAA